MEFTQIFTVKKEVDEKQFLRNVLIGLSKDEKSPSDIMKAKFGKVTEFNSEILLVSADIEVNYSGSCGYDRQEEYKASESKYVSEGEWYTCDGVQKRATKSGFVKVDVMKTRTVTDWTPHSGTIKTTKGEFVINGDNGDEKLLGLLPSAFEQAKDESVVEEGEAKVDASAYKNALAGCEGKAKLSVNWPGDHYRDARYNCKTDVKKLECYIVPCYMVEFVYNQKKYRASGLAFGKVNEIHEVPEVNGEVESIQTIEERRKSNVKEAEKPLKIKNLFVALSVIMGIVGLYGLININLPNCGAEVCLPLGFITMAVSILIAIIIHKKVKGAVAVVNANANEEKRKLRNLKVDNLIVALKTLNLPALSTQEINSISSSDDYK